MFQKTISLENNIPLRAIPEEHGEMFSHILFGETFTIIHYVNRWYKVKCDLEKQEGWIDWKMATLLAENDVVATSHVVSHDFEILKKGDNWPRTISRASSIPNLNLTNNSFVIGENEFELLSIPQLELTATKESFVEKAFEYMYAPYIWGGRSPLGIDCSGLTQNVCKMHGISIPRFSFEQVFTGTLVNSISESQIGDFVYFQNKKMQVTHVGIICDFGKVIHASGHVRIDDLDEKGLYNHDRKEYSHILHSIRRMV